MRPDSLSISRVLFLPRAQRKKSRGAPPLLFRSPFALLLLRQDSSVIVASVTSCPDVCLGALGVAPLARLLGVRDGPLHQPPRGCTFLSDSQLSTASISFHTFSCDSFRRKEARQKAGRGKVKGEFKCISVLGSGSGGGSPPGLSALARTRQDGAERPLAVTPDAEGEWEEAGEEFGWGLPGDGQSNRKQRED